MHANLFDYHVRTAGLISNSALALNSKIANIVVRLATMAMLLMLSSLAGYATYVPIYLSCCVNLYMEADYIPYWPNIGLWWLISGRTLFTLTSLLLLSRLIEVNSAFQLFGLKVHCFKCT